MRADNPGSRTRTAMKAGLYNLINLAGRLGGTWLFAGISRIIAAGYFFFSRNAAESYRFYGILYPDRSAWYHRHCTFRQYQNFTTIHLDRFLLSRGKETTFTTDGWEKLEAAMGDTGGILLMSHLGNWEIAARLLKRQKKDIEVLLYMGVKEKEGIERLQKEDLRQSGVRIIGISRNDDSPFSAVEGIRCLRAGGLVSLAGDIVWRDDQRKVRVSFLDRVAYLPEAPFVIGLVAGAPLFVFFAFRTGRNRYHFTASDPIEMKASSREDRSRAIEEAAQRYACLLEEKLRKHPLEWYHFNRFID